LLATQSGKSSAQHGFTKTTCHATATDYQNSVDKGGNERNALYKYLLFHPDTTAHPLTSPASATDASAGRSAPLPALQLAPTTEFPEPWLLLLPSRANVVAAAATQLGCEEHPTMASTSAGPAPTCASRHCKLGGIRNLFRCISERMVYRKGGGSKRNSRCVGGRAYLGSRSPKNSAAIPRTQAASSTESSRLPAPLARSCSCSRHALSVQDFVTQPVHRI
jgi:hypothetical protein